MQARRKTFRDLWRSRLLRRATLWSRILGWTGRSGAGLSILWCRDAVRNGRHVGWFRLAAPEPDPEGFGARAARLAAGVVPLAPAAIAGAASLGRPAHSADPSVTAPDSGMFWSPLGISRWLTLGRSAAKVIKFTAWPELTSNDAICDSVASRRRTGSVAEFCTEMVNEVLGGGTDTLTCATLFSRFGTARTGAAASFGVEDDASARPGITSVRGGGLGGWGVCRAQNAIGGNTLGGGGVCGM